MKNNPPRPEGSVSRPGAPLPKWWGGRPRALGQKTIYAELRRGQDGEKLDRNQRPVYDPELAQRRFRLTSDAEASPSRRAPDTEELKRRYNAMGKRKEIKFLCKDGQTREGRQDGVMFWIRKDQKREQDGLPAFLCGGQ